MFDSYIKQKNITKYRLSKETGIPYSTLTDILSGKADLKKCSALTVYKLAEEFGVSMETLMLSCVERRSSFELFKSNVCHRLKKLGDINFIIETLENDNIRSYYLRKWYPECLYLLAMLDYISRINNISLCGDYNDLRKLTLAERIYPAGVIAVTAAGNGTIAQLSPDKNAIPEFLRYNIVESDIRNVV